MKAFLSSALAWALRLFTWIPAIVEILAVGIVGAWVTIGAVQYAIESGWTMRGLLTLVNDNWKGCLILAGVIFYRTLLSVITRMRKVAGLELAAADPGTVVQTKPLRKRKQAI